MATTLRVLNLVGARPQFIKAAPVSAGLSERGAEEILVHTGQHYDDLLSDAVFADLGLRPPDINLGIGSGSHAEQTGKTLIALEPVLIDAAPDVVVVYGDTNSTIAGALAATKLHIPVAHVEAGLRSRNRLMAEELNRIATDHLSDALLAPTETAMVNLRSEGLGVAAHLVGDVMVDALRSIKSVDPPEWLEEGDLLATIHRAENTDSPERLEAVLVALGSVGRRVHLLAHPRLVARSRGFGMTALLSAGDLIAHESLPYSSLVSALRMSGGLLTDSGGLQKEAFILGVPCVTLRAETEWPETLEGDWNVIAGDRLGEIGVLSKRQPTEVSAQPFGDGHAASRIVDLLFDSWGH
jgi:UDP-N-acetylglucosamine 2-epimerase (non-hydrolysing)